MWENCCFLLFFTHVNSPPIFSINPVFASCNCILALCIFTEFLGKNIQTNLKFWYMIHSSPFFPRYVNKLIYHNWKFKFTLWLSVPLSLLGIHAIRSYQSSGFLLNICYCQLRQYLYWVVHFFGRPGKKNDIYAGRPAFRQSTACLYRPDCLPACPYFHISFKIYLCTFYLLKYCKLLA